jgi:hypothetical protein
MWAATNRAPIRDAELDRITMQNADILSRVPKSKQAALVKAAQQQTEREFRKTVEATVPGLHPQGRIHVKLKSTLGFASARPSDCARV